jgi:ABC-type multidrug transport system fused ATPase/permease subunit
MITQIVRHDIGWFDSSKSCVTHYCTHIMKLSWFESSNVCVDDTCSIITNTVGAVLLVATSGENSTGALTTRLEEDANIMSKATGMALGHKVQIAMTLLIGVLIGLVVAWQVGLVAMAVVPLIGKCTSHCILQKIPYEYHVAYCYACQYTFVATRCSN